MKAIEKIILFLWFAPATICAYLVLSSPICGLSDTAAAFLSIWIYLESVVSQINRENLQHQINELNEKLKDKQS